MEADPFGPSMLTGACNTDCSHERIAAHPHRSQTEACTAGVHYTNPTGACLDCTATCNYGLGYYELNTCSGLVDRVCRRCRVFNFRVATSGSTPCQQCSRTCEPGQWIEGDCNAIGLVADPLSCASCSPGTFADGEVTARTGSHRCTDCGPGHVCPSNPNANLATMQTECRNMAEYMDDADGTRCKSAHGGHYTVTSDGATNRDDRPHVNHVPCEVGYRCPGGQRLECNAASAKFQDQPAQSDCQDVQPGWYTTPIGNGVTTGESPCELGYWCAGGIRTLCDVNTFTDAAAQTQCAPLSSAYHAIVKTGTLRVNEVECQAGEYCSASDGVGDRIRQDCPTGSQCPYHDAISRCAAGSTYAKPAQDARLLDVPGVSNEPDHDRGVRSGPEHRLR